MKLFSFLNNSSEIESIKTLCKPYIDAWHEVGFSNGLIRGINAKFNIKRLKNDEFRIPRDTMLSNSNYIDALYRETLGTSLRSSSVFCTHNKDIAKIYGNVYYVFPIGSYSLYCNPIIRDLSSDIFTWENKPLFCSKGEILDTKQIALKTTGKNGVTIPYSTKGAKALASSSRILLPWLLTRPTSERILRIREANLEDGFLIEGTTLSPKDAYNVFWKYAFDNMEKLVKDILKKTRLMSLRETSSLKNHEVMLKCFEYFVVDEKIAKKCW